MSYKILYFIKESCIISLSFSKEIFRKGGHYMTSYDLIWHLIELLLKEKENKSDDKSQKED